MNILLLSPNFNYSCGVSKHVYLLLKHSKDNAQIKYFFITNGGDSLSRLDELGIKYKKIKFSSGIKNLFYFIPNYFFVKKYCIKNNINIIHTHHRYPEFISYLVSRTLNIKTVTTVHSYVDGYSLLSFKSYRIIAVSNYIKKMLTEKFKVEENKVSLLYNFIEAPKTINLEKIQKIRNKYGFNANDFIVLFVGRISYVKGIDILVKAFRKLNRSNDNLRLIIIGKETDNSLKEQTINTEENIYVIESQADIENYYAISSVIVLPSRVDPFPYVMLDAGLYNKAFIGSNTGGIAEFIEDGKDGLLFEPGNINQLCEKIFALYHNSEILQIIRNNLTDKVNKLSSANSYFNNLTDIYKKLF